MREIKFQFIYKGLPFSSIDNGFNWHKKVYSLNELVDYSLRTLSDVHGSCELIAKRQFTGLQDKNGVDIYEGDIVKCKAFYKPNPMFNGTLKRFVGIVTSEIFKCSMSIDGVKQYKNKQYHLHQAINIEVVGNIHQNHELLED